MIVASSLGPNDVEIHRDLLYILRQVFVALMAFQRF